MFIVACSGSTVSHVRSFLATSDPFSMCHGMTLRSAIVVFLQWRHMSSVVLRIHLLQCTLTHIICYDLMPHCYIYWPGHITAMMSYHGMRVLSFDLMAHVPSCHYPFSVYCVVITFTWIVDIMLWNRLSSLLSWTYWGITSVPQFIRFKRICTVSYIWHISELISRLYLCTRTCSVVGTIVVAVSWWPGR